MSTRIVLALMTLPVLGCADTRAVSADDFGAGPPGRPDVGQSLPADWSIVADSLSSPDPSPPNDIDYTSIGGRCPCAGGLICVDEQCRAPCVPPTDPCGVDSNCPPDQGCIPHESGHHVCMPAATPGYSCGPELFCPVEHVCASVNGSAYKCLPTCSDAGTSCGTTGGKCTMAVNGCSFCSSI